MEEFISSLPEEIRKKAEETEEYMKNWKPQLKYWNNVAIIPSFSVEAAKYAYEHWTPRKGDVFVVTYPKCGTHWMSEVVKQVYFIRDGEMMELMSSRGQGLLSCQSILESGPPAKFAVADHFPCPRIFFTHLPEELVNFKKIKEIGAKVIYVYRNPKDATVSYFHFLKNRPMFKEMDCLKEGNWEEFLKVILAGKNPSSVPDGEWFPYHIKSWLKHKDEENVKFVAFEDMKRDLSTEVRKVAEFLGVQRTNEEVAEITKRCSFVTMKSANKNPFLKKVNMFRKGEVGKWKEQFTVAQSEMMDEILQKQMSGTDIEFTYEL